MVLVLIMGGYYETETDSESPLASSTAKPGAKTQSRIMLQPEVTQIVRFLLGHLRVGGLRFRTLAFADMV